MGDFDLTTSPWVDVVYAEETSQFRRVGLRQLFVDATDIVELVPPFAPAAAGFMRVLAALTAQITGLDQADSADAWTLTRQELLREPEAGFQQADIDRMLGDGSKFSLFGESPFLQDPRLASECKASAGVNKLHWTRVAGNNQVFLSHDADAHPDPIPAGDAVWHLLAWLYYGTSGRCSSRTVDGTSASDTGAGPLRRTLSVHPVGANLYETLLLNQAYIPPTAGVSAAPWQSPRLNDPLSQPPMLSGLPAVLTQRFRHAVLLVPNDAGDAVVDAYITWAWRYPHGEVDDPYTPYQVNKLGQRFPLYAKVDRAVWRDLDSLLLEQDTHNRDDRPQVVVQLSSLPVELLERLRVRAYGYDQDGQTRDVAFFEETTPPVLSALKDAAVDERIRTVHHAAHRSGENLRTALSKVMQTLHRDSKAREPAGAMADYWSRAGQRFWQLVSPQAHVPTLPNEFIRITLQVWETSTQAYATSPEAIKTIENHRTRLFRGWRKDRQHGQSDATGVQRSARIDQPQDDDW